MGNLKEFRSDAHWRAPTRIPVVLVTFLYNGKAALVNRAAVMVNDFASFFWRHADL
jgi:hypothetical protein